MTIIRSPICTVVGHIDHGKSSILDKIRGTAIIAGEAGKITQAIGASIIPLKTIRKLCGDLLDALKIKLTISGLLFIDTPGHAAFNNLRKRGGNLADIAIIVIDINEGIKEQTIECIEILKQYKTPFIIAANKIDLIPGWKTNDLPLLQSLEAQSDTIKGIFEKKMYEIVGKLAEFELNSERFDRVDDFTKQIAIVPTSAETGEGISELLMVITGLAQRYLEDNLELHEQGPAKGTVLEVKEDKGLGKTMDVILYDGILKKNDTIVIGGLNNAISTRIKALLEPAPLAEMRDKKSKFMPVKEAVAATGVKISAPEIEEVVAGMPLRSCKKEDIEKVKEELQKEVEEVLIETDDNGIILKADSLGSLEALTTLLRGKNIPIRKATIGEITKKDIAEAESNYQKDPLTSVILGFNVEDASHLCDDYVKVITHNVIYKLIEDFENWQQASLKSAQEQELEGLVKPCKFQVMKGYVFRQNNPAVVGVDILAGMLKVGTPIMNEQGVELTEVKSMQVDQENVEKAERGKQAAVSLPGVTVGRQINEDMILLSSVPEEHFKKMKELKNLLSNEEKAILKEIAKIKRKEDPVWGI